MEAFLQIEEQPERKEAALKTVLGTAVDTGSGQLLELIYSQITSEHLLWMKFMKSMILRLPDILFAVL
jgi:hypothetical protein